MFNVSESMYALNQTDNSRKNYTDRCQDIILPYLQLIILLRYYEINNAIKPQKGSYFKIW